MPIIFLKAPPRQRSHSVAATHAQERYKGVPSALQVLQRDTANVVTRAKYAHFQPQFRVIWPPLMNMTEGDRRGETRSLSQRKRDRKRPFCGGESKKQGQLHNAEPLHGRPAKPRLATRLWKISSTRRIPTGEEAPWNFYRVAPTVLCSRIETLSRSTPVNFSPSYIHYTYIAFARETF